MRCVLWWFHLFSFIGYFVSYKYNWSYKSAGGESISLWKRYGFFPFLSWSQIFEKMFFSLRTSCVFSDRKSFSKERALFLAILTEKVKVSSYKAGCDVGGRWLTSVAPAWLREIPTLLIHQEELIQVCTLYFLFFLCISFIAFGRIFYAKFRRVRYGMLDGC